MAENKTRVESEHGLLVSEARLNRVIKVDCCSNNFKWVLCNTEWDSHAEFEACMFVCQIGSTEAQFERYFLGAFAGYIKAVTMAKLRQDSSPVISYKDMTDSPKLDRCAKRIEDHGNKTGVLDEV